MTIHFPWAEYYKGLFLKYALEKLDVILEEIKPLHVEHWLETENYRANLHFNPNYSRLIEFSKTGFYLIFTVRSDDVLVGHLSLYVTESIHTQTKLAQEDSLFLTKSARGGRTAYRLLEFAENHLKSIGVKEIYCSVKNGSKSRRLLESLGYQHVSDGMHKLL